MVRFNSYVSQYQMVYWALTEYRGEAWNQSGFVSVNGGKSTDQPSFPLFDSPFWNMVLSAYGGSPKWWMFVLDNPIKLSIKRMIWGTPILGNLHIYSSILGRNHISHHHVVACKLSHWILVDIQTHCHVFWSNIFLRFELDWVNQIRLIHFVGSTGYRIHGVLLK